MFPNNPGKPTKLKRAVYLVACTILGLLLSFIVCVFIEINYLRWAEENSYVVDLYGGYTIPMIVQIAFLIAGAVGGFFLGEYWWKKVYIERFWVKKSKK